LKRIFDASHQKGVLIDNETALEFFNIEINKRRIFFSEKMLQDFLLLGETHLPNYLNQRREFFNKQLKSKVFTEKSFQNLNIRNVPVNGIIDKIILNKEDDGEHIRVVDYKTGASKSERFASFARSKRGGSYFRQLLFYKLLVENSGNFRQKVKYAEIDFLSPDEKNIFPSKTISLHESDVEQMEKIVADTYENILNNKFSEACKKPTCKWCNFVKSQQAGDPLEEDETVSED
jgi:DNA helicase-2/ATP-dependent DNA helicase PcrA